MCRSREDTTNQCTFAATTERANAKTKETGIYYTAVRFAGYWIISAEYDPDVQVINSSLDLGILVF